MYSRYVVPLAFAVAAAAAGCWSSSSGRYWAHYTDKAFRGSQNEFDEVYTGNRNRNYKVAAIYLKLKDGTVHKLPDFPESKAREWVMQKPEVVRDTSLAEYTDINGKALASYNIDGLSIFVFHEGKLVGCGITGTMSESPLTGIQIGLTADGEFVPFPIRREDLERVFGKPDRVVQSSMTAQ
jgi:hypothetical protein